eukprot:1160741-Pelagomonas_calceolata.AAC.3
MAARAVKASLLILSRFNLESLGFGRLESCCQQWLGKTISKQGICTEQTCSQVSRQTQDAPEAGLMGRCEAQGET